MNIWHLNIILLFIWGCNNSNGDEVYRRIIDPQKSKMERTSKLFDKFEKIANNNADGYNRIPNELIMGLIQFEDSLYSFNSKFEADYVVKAGEKGQFKLAKLRRKKNGIFTDIYVLFDANNIQTDIKSILNYCENCNWHFFSISGSFSMGNKKNIEGIEILYFDTTFQKKVLHPDLLTPEDTIRLIIDEKGKLGKAN